MTEEIIIDGVNVAGCEFAVKPINDNRIKCHCVKGLLQINKMYEQPMNGLCKDNPNCYYKQLKRLEQENKELKEKIIKLSEEKGHLIVENNTLKEKNEGLKIKHQRYRECSMQLNKKYKSALEEIREKIKSLNKDICNNCGWHNTDNCQPNGYVCHDLIEIKNKINEVLNDSEN